MKHIIALFLGFFASFLTALLIYLIKIAPNEVIFVLILWPTLYVLGHIMVKVTRNE